MQAYQVTSTATKIKELYKLNSKRKQNFIITITSNILLQCMILMICQEKSELIPNTTQPVSSQVHQWIRLVQPANMQILPNIDIERKNYVG